MKQYQIPSDNKYAHGANEAKSANIKCRVSYTCIRGNYASKWKIKFYNDECTIPVSHYMCEN